MKKLLIATACAMCAGLVPAQDAPAAAKDAAKQNAPAARRMMRHDRIEFVIGTKVNESHQDPGIPQDLELRRSVVRRMAQALERNYRKNVIINFY